MTEDVYMIAITALLPLMAVLLVVQVNPYQALVIRGILGAIAALVYALLGAADVALTEALVGTMLSITLYAVAVRSSMIVRIGVIEPVGSEAVSDLTEKLRSELEQLLEQHHTRIELLSYSNSSALSAALEAKEIHIALSLSGAIKVRVQRLYNILQSGLSSTAELAYVDPARLDPSKLSK